MRHGVPACTHSVSQEMALMTGAVDAVVADYQCIMPSLPQVAECVGTTVVTTMENAKIAGATHIPFAEETAEENAKDVLRLAIRNFSARKKQTGRYPQHQNSGRSRVLGGSHRWRAVQSGRARSPQNRLSTTS